MQVQQLTYKQLQDYIKEAKAQGFTAIKLNASKEALQAEVEAIEASKARAARLVAPTAPVVTDLENAGVMVFNTRNNYIANTYIVIKAKQVTAAIEHSHYHVSAPACSLASKPEVSISKSDSSTVLLLSRMPSFPDKDENRDLDEPAYTPNKHSDPVVDLENADTMYYNSFYGAGVANVVKEAPSLPVTAHKTDCCLTEYLPACSLASKPRFEVELYTEAMSAEDDELTAGVVVDAVEVLQTNNLEAKTYRDLWNKLNPCDPCYIDTYADANNLPLALRYDHPLDGRVSPLCCYLEDKFKSDNYGSFYAIDWYSKVYCFGQKCDVSYTQDSLEADLEAIAGEYFEVDSLNATYTVEVDDQNYAVKVWRCDLPKVSFWVEGVEGVLTGDHYPGQVVYPDWDESYTYGSYLNSYCELACNPDQGEAWRVIMAGTYDEVEPSDRYQNADVLVANITYHGGDDAGKPMFHYYDKRNPVELLRSGIHQDRFTSTFSEVHGAACSLEDNLDLAVCVASKRKETIILPQAEFNQLCDEHGFTLLDEPYVVSPDLLQYIKANS